MIFLHSANVVLPVVVVERTTTVSSPLHHMHQHHMDPCCCSSCSCCNQMDAHPVVGVQQRPCSTMTKTTTTNPLLKQQQEEEEIRICPPGKQQPDQFTTSFFGPLLLLSLPYFLFRMNQNSMMMNDHLKSIRVKQRMLMMRRRRITTRTKMQQQPFFFLERCYMLLFCCCCCWCFLFHHDSSSIFSTTTSTSSIFVTALVSCTTTKECEERLRIGSECLSTGFCSNPFYKKGCLANLLPSSSTSLTNENNHSSSSSSSSSSKKQTKKEYVRVCTSSDTAETIRLGYCLPNDNKWNYDEIRLMGNNWDSVVFENWIIQIILNEILNVPTVIDTGYSDKVLDFYDEHFRTEYGKAFDWDAMRNANKQPTCRFEPNSTTTTTTANYDSATSGDETEYQSCAHVMIEIWAGQQQNIQQLLHVEKVIEEPMGIDGLVAYGGWFVPKFTVQQDPTITTYIGLQGEKNREKLANLFLRPTKWIDYCEQVSSTNCTIPDDIAQRPPIDTEDDIESDRMHVPNLYTGHFRKTYENDCETYPDNCTGHIVDYPCGWSSYIQQQIHHLDISLQASGDEPYSRGYTYNQILEIWAAANATKSNVIIPWWTPEALYQQYVHTDAEFQRINLPIPTQECIGNRIAAEDRCTADFQKRVGNALGSCDEAPQTLVKTVTKTFYDLCHNPSVPNALHNPAYATIQGFAISSLQLGVIFDEWLQKQNDKYHYDPRLAVCEWVVNHMDHEILSMIPPSYPRVQRTVSIGQSTPILLYSAIGWGIVVLLLIGTMCYYVYKLRKRRILVVAQKEFIFLLLFGLVLVQLGALLSAIPPSTPVCMMSQWLLNLGYTLELVPLIVKVNAIHRLMTASKRIQRLKLSKRRLVTYVIVVTGLVALYLLLWTILDPVTKTFYYQLTNEIQNNLNENENDDDDFVGDTIVNRYTYCTSDRQGWYVGTLVYRSILLLWAVILAIQTRKCPVNVNESSTLAGMVYSQFMLLLWSIALFSITRTTTNPNENSNSNSSSSSNTSNTSDSLLMPISHPALYQSILNSIDVAVICCIYFIPKLHMTDEAFELRQRYYQQQMVIRNRASSSTANEGGAGASGGGGGFGCHNSSQCDRELLQPPPYPDSSSSYSCQQRIMGIQTTVSTHLHDGEEYEQQQQHKQQHNEKDQQDKKKKNDSESSTYLDESSQGAMGGMITQQLPSIIPITTTTTASTITSHMKEKGLHNRRPTRRQTSFP